jgi:hypothetical protein
MALQGEWRFCSRCMQLFFAGRSRPGVCPAGGGHDASQSGDYSLNVGVPTDPGQHNWRFCSKCFALFFAGRRTPEVCAGGGTHDATGSGDYSLAISGQDQQGWRFCGKCMGLFYSMRPQSTGACPAGGSHDGLKSADYGLVSELNFLNANTPGENGWRFCNNCSSLFYALARTTGRCPAGGGHAAYVAYEEAPGVFFGDYSLEVNAPNSAGQHGWRACNKCLGLIFIGRRAAEACPAGDIHDATQSGDYSLANNVLSFVGQHGWRFCSKCTGLFFSGRGVPGICPAGGRHNATGSGDYGLQVASKPPTGPPGVKSATYAFYLARREVWEGVIPYSGDFGAGITGNLVSLTNPGANALGPRSLVLMDATGVRIPLAPGVSTTVSDVKTLYGSASPSLPVRITAAIESGVFDSIRVDVSYTYA